MNLHQIFYALEIYRTGSFTIASNNLFISQPSLSQQIKSLEQELQVTLFIRSTRRKVELTDAGEAFIKYALEIEKKFNELNETMSLFQEKKYSQIRIGFLWTFGYTDILNHLLLQFKEIYPNLEFYYEFGPSKKLLTALKNGTLDLVFVTLNKVALKQNSSDFSYDLVSCSPLQLVMNVKHPLSNFETISIKDLEGQNLMMVSRESFCFEQIFQSFNREKVFPHIIGESSQADVIMQLVQYNLGIGLLAEETIKNYPTKPINVVAKVLIPQYFRNIYLVCNTTNENHILNIQLRDFIIKSLIKNSSNN